MARFSGTLARRILGPLDSASARLLLVEDNPRHAQLFTEALGEAGVAVAGAPPFELTHVETLAAALERLAQGGIDLVLLDLTLPDGRGLDPLIEMRARFPEAPVVVFTTAADDLLSVVRLLVDDPRSVSVEEVALPGAAPAAELRLRVAESDRGKVIGRRGRTIDALRALARVRGEGEGCARGLELVED